MSEAKAALTARRGQLAARRLDLEGRARQATSTLHGERERIMGRQMELRVGWVGRVG